MKSILPLILCSILVVSACSEIKTPLDPDDAPTSTSKEEHKIEYRVSGNTLQVRVRYSNSIDGLVQVVTVPPFIRNVTANEQSLFLTLEATPMSYSALTLFPFLSAQIFVDGKLFLEASSAEFFLNPIGVSGTWRP